MSVERKEIWVYSGQGANASSLLRKLDETYQSIPHIDVVQVSYDDLMHTESIDPLSVIAFFLPGGASARYDERLGVRGMSLLNEYTSKGGRFVGICAGAWYACAHFQWAPKWGEAKEKRPDLEYFPGRGVGPIRDFGRATSNQMGEPWYNLATVPDYTKDGDGWHNAAAVNLDHISLSGEMLSARALYWDGPQFITKGLPSDMFEPVAWFKDLPENNIAILQRPTGKGQAILSSVHIEIDHHEMSYFTGDTYARYDRTLLIEEQLKIHDAARERLWMDIIYRVHTHYNKFCRQKNREPDAPDYSHP